jgi:cyclin H
MKLSEDDLYRTSTQFRNWSFTAAQLRAQRLQVNQQATERVKANVARIRAQRAQDATENESLSSGVENGSGANTPSTGMQTATEVNCLTAGDEMKIVDEFCERAVALGSHYRFPLNVVVRRSFPLPADMAYLLTVSRRQPSSSCAASTSTTPP